jgi:hypothetical protein
MQSAHEGRNHDQNTPAAGRPCHGRRDQRGLWFERAFRDRHRQQRPRVRGERGVVGVPRQDIEATKALRPELYVPDYNLYDPDATEFVGTGLNDVFVRHNNQTGERQVFVKPGEVRDGLPVWRLDESGLHLDGRARETDPQDDG